MKKLSLLLILVFFLGCGKEAVKEKPSPTTKKPPVATTTQVKKTEPAPGPAQKAKVQEATPVKKTEVPPQKAPEKQKSTIPSRKVVRLNPADYLTFPEVFPVVYAETPDLPWDEGYVVIPEQKPEPTEVETIPAAEPITPAEVLDKTAQAVLDSIDVIYMVRPGDYLVKIAIQEYNQPGYWRRIWFWNRDIIGDNPNIIYPFWEFTLKKPPELANPLKYEYYDYLVQPNESLWKIAQKEYGNPLAWIVIYRDNFDKIGSEHDIIPAGTVLKLRTRLY